MNDSNSRHASSDLPATMRAVSIARHGDYDALEVGPMPLPKLGPADVLLRTHAASLNPRDWMIRAGTYPFRFSLPKKPFVLGSDVAGTVVRVGRDVEDIAVGDEVFAMVPTSYGFGGYAEYTAVPAKVAARKPADVSFEEAAAVPLAALTALQALRDDARMRPGHRVVVVGASGGVGHYGVQIAKALGAAEVVGVCSGRNADMVRSLGADRVVDYKATPFPEALDGEAGFDARFDIVFDAVGRHSMGRCDRILTRRGAYVTTVPSARILADALRTRLWPLGRRARIVLVRSNRPDLELLAGWMEDGALRSVVDRTACLDGPRDGIVELQKHSRSFRTRGKNVLLC